MMKPSRIYLILIFIGIGTLCYAEDSIPISKDKPMKVDSLPDALSKMCKLNIRPDGIGLIERVDNECSIPIEFPGGPCLLCPEIWNIPPNFTVPIDAKDAVRSGTNGATIKRVEDKGLILLEGEAYFLTTDKSKIQKEAWEKAKQIDKISTYEDFLLRYPISVFALQAKAKIDEINAANRKLKEAEAAAKAAEAEKVLKAMEVEKAAKAAEAERIAEEAAYGNIDRCILSLKSESWNRLMKAAKTLEAIGDNRAIEPLIMALSDKDGRVRWRVSEALRKITHENFGEDQAKWLVWWKNNKGKL